MICTHGHKIVPDAREDLFFFLDRNFQITLENTYFESYTKKKKRRETNKH